jgi:hypothetical protein
MPEGVYDKAKADPAGLAPVIDVTKLGYFKVLGKGSLPDIPIIVKARYFSKDVSTIYPTAACFCSPFLPSLFITYLSLTTGREEDQGCWRCRAPDCLSLLLYSIMYGLE